MKKSISKSEINTNSYEKLSKNVHNAYRSLIPDGCSGDHCLLLSDVYKAKSGSCFWVDAPTCSVSENGI